MITFSSFVRGFKQWDSEDQKKGFLALQQWLQKLGRVTDANSIWAAIAFLIQKDHESHCWYLEFFGDQLKRLEDQIRAIGTPRQIADSAPQIADLTERLDRLERIVAKSKKVIVK